MLPALHRLHRAGEFRAAVRGRRAGSGLVVVHRSDPPRDVDDHGEVPAQPPARVGFVVSRAVGPAVVRNRVKRRLRHLVRDRLPQLQPGAVYAVRATPASATASYAELGEALDRCLVALDEPACASSGPRTGSR